MLFALELLQFWQEHVFAIFVVEHKVAKVTLDHSIFRDRALKYLIVLLVFLRIHIDVLQRHYLQLNCEVADTALMVEHFIQQFPNLWPVRIIDDFLINQRIFLIFGSQLMESLVDLGFRLDDAL